jgi:20S proteasome alpha/beta subunit
MYTSDITGNYFEYKAISIGKNDEKINEILKKNYRKEMTLNESAKMALGIFKEILGDDFDINRFNVAWIKKDEGKIKKLTKEEIKKFE